MVNIFRRNKIIKEYRLVSKRNVDKKMKQGWKMSKQTSETLELTLMER